jgi:hypothetical protein
MHYVEGNTGDKAAKVAFRKFATLRKDISKKI